MSASRRLLFAALLCAAGTRAQSPPPPPQSAPPAQREAPASPPAPRDGEPDEGLLEFLGSDDVGDAAWWDFLKKAPARASKPAPPPPDAQK